MVGLEGLTYFVGVFHIRCEYVLVTVPVAPTHRGGALHIPCEKLWKIRMANHQSRARSSMRTVMEDLHGDQ
jgi:hypothetical protein